MYIYNKIIQTLKYYKQCYYVLDIFKQLRHILVFVTSFTFALTF